MGKKQILTRLLQMLIVLIGISFLTFLLTYLSPGDPVRNMYTSAGIMPSEELIQATRSEMGLNDPFLTQYVRWITNCLKGDFGKSYSLNKPVVSLLSARLWPTLKLTLMSMVLMLIVAVPLGVLSAVNQNKPIDYIVRAVTFFGVSLPNFWVGLLLILYFCVKLRLLPVVSSGGTFKDLLLPAVTLAVAMSAMVLKSTCSLPIIASTACPQYTGTSSRPISSTRKRSLKSCAPTTGKSPSSAPRAA